MAKSSVLTSKVSPFVAFLGGSLALGVVAAGILTPGIAVANVVASDGVNLAASVTAELPLIDLQSRSTIVAKDGKNWKTIATFFNKNRVPVSSDQISDNMKNAVVAVENPSFWTDSGVNALAIARAAVQNAAGTSSSGASTITMQLVKNQIQEQAENSGDDEAATAATERTLTRKLSNAWLALGMTKEYTKDQILTQYLNISFMGGTIYGIEAAARYYFNVSAADLSIPQAALLAGMLPSPNNTSPDKKDNLPAALERRNYVLDKMLEHGYITEAEHKDAVATPIKVDITPTKQGCALAGYNAFFCEYVVATIKSDSTFGATPVERAATLNRGGLTIYTTLDLKLQKAAYQASKNWLKPGSNPFATATTSVKVGTGAILSMVQNRPYSTGSSSYSKKATAVNYAADYAYGGSNGFRAGSTFKLFTLVDWLTKGHSLNEYVASRDTMTFDQTEFTNSCSADGLNGPDWKVSNSISWGQSSMSVEKATVRSANTAFISMVKQLDLCDIQGLAESMGVSRADGSDLNMGLSDVIGNGEVNVSPLTMTNAYATIANNGVYCTVTPFVKVVDARTSKELNVKGTECTQVISPEVAAATTVALKATIATSTGVTATGANPNDGTDLAGKTGTTDEGIQNWLIGYSTEVATGTWVGDPLSRASGFDSNTTSKGVSGYNLKTKIWHDVMTKVDSLYGGSEFPSASGPLVKGTNVTVPDVTGLSATAAQKALENSGFAYSMGKTASSAVAKGLVAKTEPSAGSSAAKGSSVVIRLSDGSRIAVPKVVGQSKDVAIATLQDAGFTSLFTKSVSVTDQDQDGIVIAQSLAAKSEKPAGAKLVLSIGKYTAPASASPSDDDDDE